MFKTIYLFIIIIIIISFFLSFFFVIITQASLGLNWNNTIQCIPPNHI